MKQAAKVDENQPAIVAVLRRFGFSVHSTAALGRGFPDLVVGAWGQTYLVEVKDGAKQLARRKLTPDQVTWHADWRGRPVEIIETVTEARAWARSKVVEV